MQGDIRLFLFERSLSLFCILGFAAYAPSALLAIANGLWAVLAADTATLALVLALKFFRRAKYELRSRLFLAIIYLLGFLLLVFTGPYGAGHLYVYAFLCFSALFLGLRDTIVANAASVLGYAVFLAACAFGATPWSRELPSLVAVSANSILLGAALSLAINFLIRGYESVAEEERELARQRETMIKEIDHRVKNNLQVVSSLVNLRSRSPVDAEHALEEIRESLEAIILVHQLLDRRDSSYHVKVPRLVDALFEHFKTMYGHIAFENAWEGPELEATGSEAADLGVMINEIVMNSVKHAFVGRTGGRIYARARSGPGGELELVVGDDGRGLPADAPRRVGQGMSIIEALASNLGASVATEGPPG
ncbi:MAG: sensor histidine kinase, partial [Spirochaetaceae bacterium]|nr:sensor histidine kinase [Spirochaetaceae bacterium]